MARRITILGFWLAILVCQPIMASDSLRTVSEFARRVMTNLNLADTINGCEGMDSARIQRCVKDAAMEVGFSIGTEKAKVITTTPGTWGYLIEKDLGAIRAVALRRNKFAKALIIYSFEKLLESLTQYGYTYDTVAYFGCAVHGDSLYPYPIPNRVDTLLVIYRSSGKKLSVAADTVDLKRRYYSAVEYLATVKAAIILNRFDAVASWQALFDRVTK